MSKAGDRILKAAREALAIASGETSEGFTVHQREAVNVKALRFKLRLSQEEFAHTFGLPKRTIQDWEQGRRYPEGAARVLLKVIEKEPEAVQRALEAA
jgi:putative transcriptional regulator